MNLLYHLYNEIMEFEEYISKTEQKHLIDDYYSKIAKCMFPHIIRTIYDPRSDSVATAVSFSSVCECLSVCLSTQ